FRDFQQNAVATADYISALMNQVSALYQSENIDLQIQEIKVWTSDDPYSSISTAGELLTAFRTTKGSNFNGTLSHFLTTRSIGGGMAFLDVLCNKDYAHGVSSILTFFNNAPSYSWSVEVLAHELGHNFGSNHTHWCGWQRADGTTGPLDNCYSSDGGCSPGPIPQNGGTIMSYCHLTTQGINFSKGFGTEPGSVIRERLTNSTCIASGGSEPIGTTTTNINATTARLEWAPVPNAINYEAEYRLSGTTTWIQAGTSVGCFIQLNQLSSGTNYEWHVKTNCSSYGNSNYFTTTSVNTCSNPTGLVLTSITGISATLNWQAVSGCSRYQFQYRKAGMSTWVSVENIIGNVYQLTGLTGTTTYNWRVKADCSSYSAISNFTTTSSGCPVPASITTTNITMTGAKLNWTSSNGASSYIVSYKDQRESRWKSTNTTTTNLSLTGLIPGTNYEWKVRSNCSNTTISSSFR
ncbi:MAG: M12 family metallo-peptidase, partial [Bacteroidota bacterium]